MSNSIARAVLASIDADEVLTPADLEAKYKIKEGTQKSLRARGLIPFIRLGEKIIRYRRTEIENWLSENSGRKARRAGGAR